MKLSRKILLVFFSIILGISMISCGDEKKEEVIKEKTPSECLKIQVDVLLFGNEDDKDKVGITDEEINNSKRGKEFMIDYLTIHMFGKDKEFVTSEEIELFVDKYVKGLKNCEIKYISDKINNDKAEVTMTIRGIDMAEYYRVSLRETVEYISDNPGSSKKETAKFVIKEMGNFYDNPSLVKEGKTLKIAMEKNNDYWKASGDEIMKISSAFHQNYEGLKEMNDSFD